jgi:hypothetical protein
VLSHRIDFMWFSSMNQKKENSKLEASCLHFSFCHFCEILSKPYIMPQGRENVTISMKIFRILSLKKHKRKMSLF